MNNFEELEYDEFQYSDPDDCDIEICSGDNDFVDISNVINTYEETKNNENIETLIEWWPELAKKLMYAMFSSTDEKKNAIQSFMKVFDYTYEQSLLQINSDEIQKLYDLHYSNKIKEYELKAENLVTTLCNALTLHAETCEALILEKDHNINILKSKAKQIYMKHKNNCNIAHIIDEEFQKSVADINKDFMYNIKILKLSQTLEMCTTFNTNKISDNNTLEKYYETVIHNIDVKLCQQIISECNEHWMSGLM